MPDRFKAYLAAYLILRKGNEICMLRRAHTGYEDGNYGLIQGHLEGGETAEECIVREAKEEVGIDINLSDVRVVHVQHEPATRGGEYICVYLEASKWQGDPYNAETAKCDDVRWFDFAQLPENAIPNVRFALSEIDKGIIYSNFGWNRQI